MFELNDIQEDATMDELEEVVMGLIINAGQARSLAYTALKRRKKVIL